MTQFIRDKAAASEAQQKKALSFLFAQDSTGLASDGVLAGLVVSQTATASASVTVAAGACVVQDSVGNGASMPVSDTQETLDVLTANPMGGTPRNDIVVFDSATVSGGTGGLRVIIGTPNAVPTDPTVPTTAVKLARIRNAASATTVPSSAIDNLIVSTSLFGSVLTVLNQADRDARVLTDGLRVYRLDTHTMQTYNAADAAWYPRVGSNIAGSGWADNTGTPFNGTSYRRTADGLCQLSGLLYRTDPTFSTTASTFYTIGFVPSWMAPTDCAKQFTVWTSAGFAMLRVTTAGSVQFASLGTSYSIVSGTTSVSVESSWWR